MSLSDLLRPFGGTFLVFSDYMRGAVRLAALMQTDVTFVWTHDSIGLGEDGPTHQPVEHLWALRAIPGLVVVRPADANETAVVWHEILRRRRPTGLALTRQNLPTVDRTVRTPRPRAPRAAATCSPTRPAGHPQVLLLATGSEVQLALAARDTLEADGVPTRVVSLPCLEWFEEQDAAYRESVLPSAVRARVSVEAGIAQGWWKYLGTDGRAVSLEHFGASADQATLFREFGITADAVVAAARESLPPRPDTRARSSVPGGRRGRPCVARVGDMSDDRLADLSAAGVSIWLDDLDRGRLVRGRARRARRRLPRRRGHHEPVHLREGDRGRRRRVRRPGARPRRPRCRRSTRRCAR